MDAVFKKLNYKDQKKVFVLNAPDSFEANIDSIKDRSEIFRTVGENGEVEFAIGFATKQTEVDAIAEAVGPKLKGDAIFWICYPKGTSKKYKCDFNRDTGWTALGKYNLEGVRQIAIDEDWSALRFRKIDYIKNFNRREQMALSETGKSRTKK